MRTVEKEVKLKKVVVDVVDIEVYETIEDLDSIEAAALLSLVNRQHTADVCNKARAKHREKTAGKGKRNILALNLLPTIDFGEGETGLDRLNTVIRDAASAGSTPDSAMKELLGSKIVQDAVDEALRDEPVEPALTE